MTNPIVQKFLNGEMDAGGTIHTLEERIEELEDLLTSARAIAERQGQDVAWERFSERLHKAGIGSVTAKVFKILESDK